MSLFRLERPTRSHLLFACLVLFAAFAAIRLTSLGNPSQQARVLFGLISVGALALVFVRPWYGLPFLLAAAPFQMRIVEQPVFVGTNEALLVAVSLLLLPRVRWTRVPSWLLWGYGMVVIGSLVPVPFSADPEVAFWGAARWLFIGGVACYTVQHLLDHPQVRARCLRSMREILSWTTIIVSSFAILQSKGIYWVVGPPYLSDRLDSSFGYYTVYAGFMAMACVLTVSYFLEALNRSDPLDVGLHGIALVMAAVGIGVSLSRGALLAAVVGLVILYFLDARRLSRALGLFAGVSGLIAVAWLVTPHDYRDAFVARMSQPFGSSGSDQIHDALATIGTRALAEHPFGLGYGGFPEYLAATGQAPWFSTVFFHSHRLPVQIGLDAGWIGLAGCTMLVVVPVISGVSAIRANHGAVVISGGIGAMAGAAAQGWFDYLAYETSFLVYFAYLTSTVWLLATTRVFHGDGEEASPEEGL